MGLFDKAAKHVKKIFNAPRKADTEPAIPKSVSSAWERAEPSKPSFLDRLRERASGIFKPRKQAPAARKQPSTTMKQPSTATNAPEAPTQPFKAPSTPRHFKPSDKGSRQEEIFRFRRNAQEEGNAFYRLTQSIWDDPNVPAGKRDEAIRDYFERKYGLTDMNEIYDFVLERNRDIVEKYRNSPNALKYEVLKNMRIENAEL